MTMHAPVFRTITSDDWRHILARARERRAGAPARIREAVERRQPPPKKEEKKP